MTSEPFLYLKVEKNHQNIVNFNFSGSSGFNKKIIFYPLMAILVFSIIMILVYNNGKNFLTYIVLSDT